ncbi:MAG: ABC transporter permease, partial [Clostridiales bacterium]|nr:ABC transporter permease [Clostridiales bacterium]
MGLFKSILRQRNVMFRIGMGICLLWIVVALLTFILPIQDPLYQTPADRFQSPSGSHWLGTDNLGRDVFSRVLCASRVSITAGLITVCFSFLLGAAYGAVAGYSGGVVDDAMMRLSEMVMSFPPLILAMVIAAAMGPSVANSVLAMAIIWWPNYARLTRSIVISVKNNEYVTASRIMGAGRIRILLREIMPNSIGPLIVMATLDIGNAILMFSGLSFLGLG